MTDPLAPLPQAIAHELALVKPRLLARLRVLASAVELLNLNPDQEMVRDAMVRLVETLDQTLTCGGSAWGLPARARVVLLDEEVDFEDLRDLARTESEEVISVPPTLLRRLLAAIDAVPTPSESPATVDVFVNHVKCRPAPGRGAGPGHRWLIADVPSLGNVEVLVKPSSARNGAGS